MELIGYILLTGGIITVVVFLFHCVIWLIKLFADISWDTWAWTKYCFWGTLVVALLAFIYRVATYFYAKYRHSENERLNNLTLQRIGGCLWASHQGKPVDVCPQNRFAARKSQSL